ncbi:unnamed protein product [Owenia fusiformis]|uniref:Uncharacterized protein n=1 Tax=Owenia fusiformis TaxID=6347 RepID=A0A8J1XQM3_OWEFU|nr:unnamed protein product [Owenia fusiformis]
MVGANAGQRMSSTEVKKRMEKLYDSVKEDIPPPTMPSPQRTTDSSKKDIPARDLPIPPRKSPSLSGFTSSGKSDDVSSTVIHLVVHRHTKCRGCKQAPITGIRYLCYKHRDCSYCASCRRQGKQTNANCKFWKIAEIKQWTKENKGLVGKGTLHHGMRCSECEGPIVGELSTCTTCDDYNLCEICAVTCTHKKHRFITTSEPQKAIPRPDNEKSLEKHPGVTCDGCMHDIYGKRYKCAECENYDLCSVCEGVGLHENHKFLVIDRPDARGSTAEGIGYQVIREMVEQQMKQKEAEKKAAESDDDGVRKLAMLMAMLSGDESGDFSAGDVVYMTTNLEKAKELQEGHGGWNDLMARCLGKRGVVSGIVSHVRKVKFDDGMEWSINPALLSKNPDKGAASGKFNRYDIVVINCDARTLQQKQIGHGGCNEEMVKAIGVRGIVHGVDSDNDVVVEFINSDKWCLNPELLTKVDTSKEEIESGSLVIIIDDYEKVKQLQQGHGGWVSKMIEALGHAAVVKRVAGQRVEVDFNGNEWVFNKKAVVLVASGEEMIKVVGGGRARQRQELHGIAGMQALHMMAQLEAMKQAGGLEGNVCIIS